MKCIICDKEKGFSIITDAVHRVVMADTEALTGICFDCYETVPEYIPRKQVKMWLERKVGGKWNLKL